MTRASLLALVGLLGVGCNEPAFVIVADVSKNCNEVVVEPVIDAQGFGVSTILDAAATPTASGVGGTASVWLLLLVSTGSGDQLAVRHVVDGTVTREVPIPLPSQPGSIVLRGSPDPDEVFVLHRGSGTFRVWRVAADLADPGVQSSQELVGFPHDTFTCAPCDTSDWHRDLLFLDNRPYVVSVPPLSENAAVSVWVGALSANPPETGTLNVGTEHRLNFERMCQPNFDDSDNEDSDLCEANKLDVSYPTVTVLGRQHDPRPTYSRMLIHRERAEAGYEEFTVADVFVVTLELDADGIPKGVLRSYQGFDEPVTSTPSGLVVDRFSTYAMYTTRYADPPTRLLELPAPTADFEDITTALGGAIGPDTQLLPLDQDVALGEVVDGTWEITKLFPDDLSKSGTTVYAPERPISGVRAVGPGYFLLAHDEGRPDVVRVRCIEPSFED